MTSPRAGRGDGGRDAGFTTAEFAVGLPAVAIVLFFSAALLGLLLDQIQCVDAARAAARSVARGDRVEVAEQQAQQVAPEGSAIRISRGRTVRVEVTGPVRYGSETDGVRAKAEAVAPDESYGLHGRRLGGAATDPVHVPHMGAA